jgi:hypothetical protein
MADIINEGDSKLEVVDASTDGLARIYAELNAQQRFEITSTEIAFYNPNDQIETGNATDNNQGAASTFNGLQTAHSTIHIQSGNGTSVPQSNLYIDGKSIISDKTLSIGTTGQKELHFGTNGTQWVKITESGYLDFSKLTITGNQGTAGQLIRNAGSGTIEWYTPDNRNSFGSVVIGGSSIDASSVGDNFEIVAGTNISLGVAGSQLTINATQPNVFSTIQVSGQNDIVGDSSSDTLTFIAGTGISLATDSANDTVTITNTVTAQSAADAVFKTITTTGQANVVAGSSTDTLNLGAGAGIEITTNDASSEISFRNEALERLSKEGYLTYTKSDGTTDKMALRNFFVNNSTSLPVNGGGSQVGFSTRALRLLQSDGNTFKFMIMPANSNGESLVFTYQKSDGTTVTKDITMAA